MGSSCSRNDHVLNGVIFRLKHLMESWLEQSGLSERCKPLSDAGINTLEIAARQTKEDLKRANIEQSDIVERLLTACSSLNFGKIDDM